jgi:hypothetical protein
MVERGIKENEEGDKFNMIYLTYCKNICKCHHVPPANNKKRLKIKWNKGSHPSQNQIIINNKHISQQNTVAKSRYNLC